MTAEELLQATRELIKRWDNIRITGQGWSGDARRGFQFNPIPTSTNATTPVTTSGACCPATGSCFIATRAICEAGGGTYQGDNTTCDPDPCCPSTVTVTFDSVILDCGCTPTGFGSDSMIVTDFAFNGNPETLHTQSPLGCCSFDSDYATERITETTWFGALDCTGVPHGPFPDFLQYMFAVLDAGVWHVLAAYNNAAIFYGNTTSDPITAITNQVTCTTTLTDWDGGVVMNCLFGAPRSLRGIGHAGTVAITF